MKRSPLTRLSARDRRHRRLLNAQSHAVTTTRSTTVGVGEIHIDRQVAPVLHCTAPEWRPPYTSWHGVLLSPHPGRAGPSGLSAVPYDFRLQHDGRRLCNWPLALRSLWPVVVRAASPRGGRLCTIYRHRLRGAGTGGRQTVSRTGYVPLPMPPRLSGRISSRLRDRRWSRGAGGEAG